MSSQITETQYHELVDQLLLSIEEALDDFAVDIDTESAEGILTLTFENGSRWYSTNKNHYYNFG